MTVRLAVNRHVRPVLLPAFRLMMAAALLPPAAQSRAQGVPQHEATARRLAEWGLPRGTGEDTEFERSPDRPLYVGLINDRFEIVARTLIPETK
jgi:hypothetical protein